MMSVVKTILFDKFFPSLDYMSKWKLGLDMSARIEHLHEDTYYLDVELYLGIAPHKSFLVRLWRAFKYALRGRMQTESVTFRDETVREIISCLEQVEAVEEKTQDGGVAFGYARHPDGDYSNIFLGCSCHSPDHYMAFYLDDGWGDAEIELDVYAIVGTLPLLSLCPIDFVKKLYYKLRGRKYYGMGTFIGWCRLEKVFPYLFKSEPMILDGVLVDKVSCVKLVETLRAAAEQVGNREE